MLGEMLKQAAFASSVEKVLEKQVKKLIRGFEQAADKKLFIDKLTEQEKELLEAHIRSVSKGNKNLFHKLKKIFKPETLSKDEAKEIAKSLNKTNWRNIAIGAGGAGLAAGGIGYAFGRRKRR